MIISKDNKGNIIGWRLTYFSTDEIVNVSVNGNINTVSTQNKTTGGKTTTSSRRLCVMHIRKKRWTTNTLQKEDQPAPTFKPWRQLHVA